jgi:hypothetical protein
VPLDSEAAEFAFLSGPTARTDFYNWGENSGIEPGRMMGREEAIESPFAD